VTWQIFEQAAESYERWYTTPRGRRSDAAERGLLLYLLEPFQNARSALEVGCGTGHFAEFLSRRGLRMIALDRSPAMLAEAARRFPSLNLVLGDAHHLPFRDASTDLAVFVTALEFLEDPARALREAVRVARQGVVAVVLNRYSLGGVSRRWRPQSRGQLLSQARDFSVADLRSHLKEAAKTRADGIWMASALFPNGLSGSISRIPLGDVLGGAVKLESVTAVATVGRSAG
jgi:ubiquinone/menaquinone biosynthesis C-methylase UbiE